MPIDAAIPTVAYPSLLDSHSTDRNFMTVGATAELFLTRFNATGCKTNMDRDLVRVPIAVSAETTIEFRAGD